MGFEGVQQAFHGCGEVLTADAAGDRAHVWQDLDRVVGVFAGLRLRPVDDRDCGFRASFGLPGTGGELLAGVVAVPPGEFDDGIEDRGFRFLRRLRVGGGVVLRDLDSAAHRYVLVDHDPIVVVPGGQGERSRGIIL